MITKGKLTAAAVLAAIGGTALCSCTADSDLIHITPYVQDQAQQGVTTASVADNVTTTAEMDIMTTTTEESTTTTTTTTTSPVLRGNIYDCNKTLITYSTRTEDGVRKDISPTATNILSAISSASIQQVSTLNWRKR